GKEGTYVAQRASNHQDHSGRRKEILDSSAMTPKSQPADAVRKELVNARVVMESRGLKKNYGTGPKIVAVLTDANLVLREGEMVAVVAPSGAGKSTLLHLLAALDMPTSGTVYFDSKALETNDDAALVVMSPVVAGFYGCGK